MKKQCFKCSKTKDISLFYEHKAMTDGHLGKCIECTKKDTAERAAKKKQDPEWLKAERERCRIKQAKRRALGLDLTTKPSVQKKWARQNKHKRQAQNAADMAQRRGVISKPDACENCGAIGYVEKHHPDYTQPLKVQWLCKPCHGRTRRKDQ